MHVCGELHYDFMWQRTWADIKCAILLAQLSLSLADAVVVAGNSRRRYVLNEYLYVCIYLYICIFCSFNFFPSMYIRVVANFFFFLNRKIRQH